MIVLGLHFGHDAAVSVLRDGLILTTVLGERQRRIKHAMALDLQTLRRALEDAGIRLEEVDWCAITSTQKTELVATSRRNFALTLERHPADDSPSSFETLLKASGTDPRRLLGASILEILYDRPPDYPRERHACAAYFPEYKRLKKSELFRHGWLDVYCGLGRWAEVQTLAALAEADYSECLAGDHLRHGFHLPVTVTLEGRRLPGAFVSHHMAHAASAYYPSGMAEAAIFTHDRYSDGRSYHGGMFYRGQGHKIFPLTPHHLVLGTIYEDTGTAIGLGIIGAAGKLMGLAPYGTPSFAEERFVGNAYELAAAGIESPARDWMAHCLKQAAARGYDRSAFRDPARMTEPINADIAASTQQIFEASMLRTVEAFSGLLAASGTPSRALCLSGGTMLNCPANTKIAAAGTFDEVFVPPWCDDSGLAAGAALALWHNVLDRQPAVEGTRAVNASAYQGPKPDFDDLARLLRARGKRLRDEEVADPAAAAAEDLAQNRVIAWFEGRSEVGPRALGHRSILADPRDAGNWARVNRIKGREAWRPFAPAVLEEEAAGWFEGCPLPSPYMLFTAQVRRPEVPAITHVDGSSRIQTVGPEDGAFRRLLEVFHGLTGCPVVMNTSFNGPGEPIVETAANALDFLERSGLDALYIGARKVTRRA
jgi:carbamoyltransferase